MESSSAVARYLPRKSNSEPEVIEIASPLADRTARLKAKGKQKVVHYEVIDVDVDNDCKNAVLYEGNVESITKRKCSMDISLGSNGAVKLESIEGESNKKRKEVPFLLGPVSAVKLESEEFASNKKAKAVPIFLSSNSAVKLEENKKGKEIPISLGSNSAVKLESKEVASNTKAKEIPFSLGSNSAVKLESKEVVSNKKGKEIPVEPGHFPKGFNPGSNNFFDLDDYVYDDDYSTLKSHFGKAVSPAGIEATFPGFPDPMKKENPTTPFVTSNSHLKASVSQEKKVDPWFSSSKNSTAVPGPSIYIDPKPVPAQTRHSNFTQVGSSSYFSNNCIKNNTAVPGQSSCYDPKTVPAQSMHSNYTPIRSRLFSSHHSNKNSSFPGQSSYLDPKPVPAQTMHSNFVPGQSSYFDSKPFPPQTMHSNFAQTGSSSYLSNNSNKKGTGVPGQSTYVYPKPVPPQTTHSNFAQTGSSNYLSNNSDKKSTVVPGQSTYVYPKPLAPQTVHSNFAPTGSSSYLSNNSDKKNTVNPGQSTYFDRKPVPPQTMHFINGMLSGQDMKPKESSSGLKKLGVGDVQKKYESFKKFGTVVDHSDHYYVTQNSALMQPAKNWAKKIQEEWRILEKDLPDTIFVRAYESRMDLLRAVIIGAEGTPYHDGLFFFDVCFPSNYPSVPPLVHYHSGGLRINPNLYNCGKVCLSLLNTWSGGHQEKWLPGTSTMLQVLVSIQGLILNMKPYFNEPGFAHSSGSVNGEKSSLQYNENTLILSLKTMVYTMNKPPKNFEDLVIGHFQHRVRDILMACKAYTEGVQVGCLVKGGVQDVDEGNNSCSPQFKYDVVSYIKTLIAAFEKIGAKEAQDFLYLSVQKTSLPSAPTLTPIPLPFPPANVSYPTPVYNQHW